MDNEHDHLTRQEAVTLADGPLSETIAGPELPVVDQIVFLWAEYHDRYPPFMPSPEIAFDPGGEERHLSLLVRRDLEPNTVAQEGFYPTVTRVIQEQSSFLRRRDEFPADEKSRLGRISDRHRTINSGIKVIFQNPHYQPILALPGYYFMFDNMRLSMFDFRNGQVVPGEIGKYIQYAPAYLALGHDPAYLALNLWHDDQADGRRQVVRAFYDQFPPQLQQFYRDIFCHNLLRKGIEVSLDQLKQAINLSEKTPAERLEHQQRCIATLGLLETALSLPATVAALADSIGRPFVALASSS
ncbi:MAG TPA: hypothetical protein VMW41_02000 [Candidatus Bathyarchaeia archaeon]|nr:hypothetical protein [Candidatus Bathyarchaeia archaeon]